MRLYTISGAPRGWRVQLALAIKGLDYELALLEGSQQEHRQKPYLEINPRGVVPTLEHQGRRITDSLGIMAWLDRKFPDRPLFGETADEAGTIWSLATDFEDYLRPAQNDLIFPLLVERILPAKMTPKAREMSEAAAETLGSELQRLEEKLAVGPFLCGPRPSAADAVAFPEVRIIQRANDVIPKSMQAFGFDKLDHSFPRIRQWMKHVSALPGFEKTLPAHWSTVAA